MQLHVVDLRKGTVVTGGWISFNHPQYCRYAIPLAVAVGCAMARSVACKCLS